MRTMKQLTLPLALFFIIVCAKGQDIHYNYDRGASFQSYRTYQWVDLKSGPPKADVPAGLPNPPAGFPNLPIGSQPGGGSSISDDQLLDQDIKRAVDAQLAEKRLTKVEKGGDPPTVRKVAEALGFQITPKHQSYDVVIVGGGPGDWQQPYMGPLGKAE